MAGDVKPGRATDPGKGGKAAARAAREARLGAALRANIRRRKASAAAAAAEPSTPKKGDGKPAPGDP